MKMQKQYGARGTEMKAYFRIIHVIHVFKLGGQADQQCPRIKNLK